MLGPHPRIIEAGRNRMRRGDLAVVALQEVAHAAVEHADGAGAHRGAVTAGRDPLPTRLGPDDPHLAVADDRMEEPDRVRPAADTGDQDVGEPAEERPGLPASPPASGG